MGMLAAGRHVFSAERVPDRVPGEKSELKGWAKAEADSMSRAEPQQEPEQRAERVMRVALSTMFLLPTNSSTQ